MVQQPLTRPNGYATVWIFGGVAAAAYSMGPKNWLVPTLTATSLVSCWGAWAHGYSWWIVALRMLADVSAVLVAGVALRRHVSSAGTVGRDWLISALAILGASMLRATIMIPTAASDETAYSADLATLGSLMIASMIGFSIGQIFGAAAQNPRAILRTRREVQIFVGIMLASAAFLTATAMLPAQVDRYASPLILDAPIVILAALSLSYIATTVIASLLVMGQGALMAQGLGVYRDVSNAPEIVGYQASLLVSVLFMFMFAAIIEGKREEQRAVESAARLAAASFDLSPVPTARVTGSGDLVIAANDALASLAWRPTSDINGRPLSSVLVPVRGSFADAQQDRGFAEILVSDRVGNESWLRVSRSHVDENVDVLVLVDITTERMSEELMKRHARTDSMTGIPNRAAALEHLALALEKARPGYAVGVIIADIDRLRRVNDTLGRPAGDAVIEAVSRILVRTSQGRGSVGRIGEDEFLITMPEVESTADVESLAAAMITALSRPLTIEGTEVIVSLSLGGTLFESASNIESALRTASAALVQAKSHAPGTALIRPAGHHLASSPDGLAIEHDLRAAITGNGLVVHFQPIVHAGEHDICGAEALVRLARGDGTLLEPAAFLPIARDLGLLNDLTWCVLREAVQEAARWQSGQVPITVSVNVPPRWLLNTDPQAVLDVLAEAGLSPTALSLEITEDELVDEATTKMVSALDALRAHGIRIAMDDFGTGYAGLGAFRSLPVDVVKIDRSFVTPLADRNADDVELVGSIVRLIHRFGRVVIAEGVETAAQASVLTELGCDLLQGFRFGRALDAVAFRTLLKGGSTTSSAVPI